MGKPRRTGAGVRVALRGGAALLTAALVYHYAADHADSPDAPTQASHHDSFPHHRRPGHLASTMGPSGEGAAAISGGGPRSAFAVPPIVDGARTHAGPGSAWHLPDIARHSIGCRVTG
jgi:hypothetical protein